LAIIVPCKLYTTARALSLKKAAISSEFGDITISDGGAGTAMTAKLARATEASLIWVRERYVYLFAVVVEKE